MVLDEIKMYLSQGEASVLPSGRPPLERNPKLAYTVPKEGSNIWLYNIVIPKTARNVEGAYALINFSYALMWQRAMPTLLCNSQQDSDGAVARRVQDKCFLPWRWTHCSLRSFIRACQLVEYNDHFREVKIEAK